MRAIVTGIIAIIFPCCSSVDSKFAVLSNAKFENPDSISRKIGLGKTLLQLTPASGMALSIAIVSSPSPSNDKPQIAFLTRASKSTGGLLVRYELPENANNSRECFATTPNFASKAFKLAHAVKKMTSSASCDAGTKIIFELVEKGGHQESFFRVFDLDILPENDREIPNLSSLLHLMFSETNEIESSWLISSSR